MDCQNLANVLSGIRDMDALSDSGRGTLSPAVVGSLLDAVASKLPSYDAKEIEQEEEKEESSHSRRSGESRASRLDSSSSSDRDRFTTDGLVALCLALCYIDRHTGTPQLSLLRAQDSSNSLLKGIMRAVSACCRSVALTSIQAALFIAARTGRARVVAVSIAEKQGCSIAVYSPSAEADEMKTDANDSRCERCISKIFYRERDILQEIINFIYFNDF